MVWEFVWICSCQPVWSGGQFNCNTPPLTVAVSGGEVAETGRTATSTELLLSRKVVVFVADTT